ncbi:hypothetical protein IU459_27160 [Nocardia amamiensis]|uniref:Uncharacterized protein n=1 Tax=Nocardia amamiensis TaxID=404578 RepID=A0ABS0CXW5_9NOCA|nr:hypothetical protein [Nocardia amamiensis]MBF6301196.1 hypothetical protein [Nocardia amamiensis]
MTRRIARTATTTRKSTARDADKRLIAVLTALGETYSPLGVALAAAVLTDPAVLIHRLTTSEEDSAAL